MHSVAFRRLLLHNLRMTLYSHGEAPYQKLEACWQTGQASSPHLDVYVVNLCSI
jgi:hypothetical protein